MTPERAWVRLPSGHRLDLLAPDPRSWTDRDLAISLSRTYRWGGHSSWELPISVAQHSLLVLVLRQRMEPGRRLSPAEALREILHDAEEALIGGFDPIRPLKPHLGAGFHALIDRIRAAIDARYDLPPWSERDRRLHQHADRLAAASEALHCAGWSRADIRDTLRIAIDPLDRDPMPRPRGMGSWQPWDAGLAASLFLAMLGHLTAQRNATTPVCDLCASVAPEETLRLLMNPDGRTPARRCQTCRTAPDISSRFSRPVHATADAKFGAVEREVTERGCQADTLPDDRACFPISAAERKDAARDGHQCNADA